MRLKSENENNKDKMRKVLKRTERFTNPQQSNSWMNRIQAMMAKIHKKQLLERKQCNQIMNGK